MTEKEAKSKWCPMTRFHVVENSPLTVYSNRDENDLPTRCMGSECMMWRWKTPLSADIDGNYYSNGFCGLGGKE
jgi:hypothetical protein